MPLFMIEFPRPDINDITHTRYGYAFVTFKNAQECVKYVAKNKNCFCNPHQKSAPTRIYDETGGLPICIYDFVQRRAFWRKVE